MRLRFAFFVVLLFIAAIPSFGQSVLNFARVISTQQIFTGLAISNPTSAEAAVTFSAFQPDGSLFTATGIANPVTVNIPAGGQYARMASDIFPASGIFNGWIQATSSTSGLSGFSLNANTAVTDLDGAGAGTASAEFTLPLAYEDGQAQTELTLLNSNSEPVAVNLILYATDGTILANQDLTIAAKALIRQTLQPIFGNIDLTNASHVHVKAAAPLVSLEAVADFQIPGIAMRRETIEIAGRQASAAQDYVLPEFVSGGGWASYLNIVNGSGLSQDITVTAYKDDGTLWDLSTNPMTVTLPGNGSIKGTVEQLFGLSSSTANTGWIKVHSLLGFLISNVAYGNTATPSFAAVSGIDVSQSSSLNVHSQISEGGSFFTGLTIVNPGNQPANVEFYALRPDGTTVGKSTFTIGPNERFGKLLREILPATFGQTAGWAFLRSSQPLIGTGLLGSANLDALANIPLETPAGDFFPAAQTTAAITGTIHQDATAVSGATVTLTGPVTTSLTTDSSGLFAFTQLPAGQYIVSVSMPGAQFFPSQQPVTLAQSNVDGIDFNAVGIAPAAAPSVSFVSPAAVFAGSSGLSISVLGSNFNQTSAIYLNGQPLPTSFVSGSELHAAVPSSMVAAQGTLNVTVVTPPPGGGTSNSATLAINVLPNNPLIAGRVGVGSFPAGVAIHPGRQIALVANESGDSVSIIDLKTLQVVTEVKVGRSPSEGIAVFAEKDLALVADPGSNNVSVIDLTTNQVVKTIDVQSFPLGVAINPATRRALVTNFESNSVSVIDLDALSVVATIAGLNGPNGVAINPNTNIAVVANRIGNSVSLIDLASNTITAAIPVGLYPRGVSINLNNNTAIVANASSNTVTIVDLGAKAVIGSIPVNAGPTGVAVHEATNFAVVTNSGVTAGQVGLNSTGSVSFIDLNQLKDIQDVQVESAPFGVAVDSDLQEAIVANFGSNDVTIVRIPNPTPLVTDVEPKTFPAGGGPFTITVNGTGFLPTSVVTLNGQPLPTTFVSSTQLQAVVGAALLQQLLQPQVPQAASAKSVVLAISADTTSINFNVGVSNPGPGGGASPPPKDPTTTRIQPQNPLPVLVSISPTKITVDAPQLQLTLSGNNFNGTSIVNFGGAALTPASVSSTAMTVNIPVAGLSPGDVPVSVTNPAPGGGTSAALTFSVLKTSNPAPSISAVAPTEIAVGSNATAIHITGNSFINSAVVSIQGSAVQATITSTTIDFTLPASLLNAAGSLSGLVTNPEPGGGSASFTINVLNPAPVVTNLSPQETTSGISSLALSVTGSHFIATSVVTIEGTPVTTQVVNSGQLSATVSGTILAHPGSLHVAVSNPAPGGGTAAAGILTLDPGVPRLDSISPSSLRADQAGSTLTLAGANFANGATVVFGGVELSATFVSASQLRITLSAPLIFGTSSVVVKNPAPGGPSNAVNFLITSLTPVINSIQPSPVSSGQRITISGSNFGVGSNVTIGGVSVTPNVVSDTQMTALVPSSVPAGNAAVTVVNPPPGGGTSNPATIQINASIAAIASLSPSTVTRDQTGTTITVTGRGFARDAVVQLDGTPASTTFVSDTALTFALPALAHAGAVTVTVVNPPPGGGISTGVALNVQNPAPAISSISPDSGYSGTSISITVNGTGFVSDSQIVFGSQGVRTTFVNSTTLTGGVNLTALGGQTVAVVNAAPGGGTSNSLSFAVNQPPNGVPVITSVSPATVGGNGGLTITINGMGFVAGASVSIGGNPLPAVIGSATSITAMLPTLTPGSYNIVVTNPPPGGGASNPFAISAIATPAITALSPGIAAPGTASLTMTITGANFGTSTSAVSVALGGTNLAPLTVTPTQVAVNIPAPLLASAIQYPVIVSVNGVASNSVAFDVAFSDTFVPNLSNPRGIVFDGQNNVFVANSGNGSILEISPLGALSTYATGFSTGGLSGLAFSAAGDLYAADALAGTISKVSTTGTVTTFATGLNQPANIRFDGSGNLLVADAGDGTIKSISPAGVVSTYASLSGTAPFGLVMDSAGNLYASDYASGAIYTITGNGPTATPIAFMDKLSDSLAMDSGGRIFVANGSEGNINRIETDGRVALAASGLTATGSIPMAFDANGVLFVGANGSLLRYAAQVSTSPSANPFVSRMEPAAGTAGNTVSANILGSGLTGASAVNFSSTSVSATIQSGGSSAAVPVNIAVSASASTGTSSFTVTTPAGATNSSPFVVVGLPSITSITPAAATATSDPFVLTVTGTNFQSDALIQFGGAILVPTARQSGQLTVTVPSTAVLNIGVVNVSVKTAGAVSNAIPFNVKTPVTAVTITPSSVPAMTAVGATAQFQATAKDANGNVVSGKTFAWASSNTGVASIDSTGLATAVDNGQVTITATVDGVSATATLAVNQALATIAITPAASTLVSVGATQQFALTLKDANGNGINNLTAVWSSSSTGVATIDAGAGIATAVGGGTTTIKATVGNQSATVSLTVTPAVASIAVSPSTATLQSLNLTQAFSAVARDANGNSIPGKAFTWSSDNSAVASINSSTGVATSLNDGGSTPITIRATVDGQVGTATIVVSPQVASVSVSAVSNTIASLGATQQFTALVKDANNQTLTTKPVTWSVDRPAVATVDSASGVVKAVTNGTALITATAGGQSGSLSLTVSQTVHSISISPAGATLNSLGATQPFTAVLTDAGGNPVSGQTVTWSSSNTTVAGINSSGVATANQGGTTTITASAGNASASAALTVSQSVATVSLSPASNTLVSLGATLTFTLSVSDANGTAITGLPVTWTSSQPSFATVDNGTVKAVANGSTTITATVGGKSATAQVIVAQAVNSVQVVIDTTTNLTVGARGPGRLAIRPRASATASSQLASLGDSIQFRAIAQDALGNAVSGPVVTWVSSRPDLVSIDGSGKTTAVQNGNAVVTASVGGIAGTANVTVQQVVASVTLQPSSRTFASFGDTQAFQATPFDARGNQINGKTVTWSAATPVTVDTTGLVTAGTTEGTSTLTATIDGKSTTANLTVSQVAVSITISPATKTLTVLPGAQDFTVTALDARGNSVNKPITWSSSTSSVAAINSSGHATAAANGRTTISATIGNTTGLATLIVAQGSARIDVSEGSHQFIALKRIARIIASYFDANGNAGTPSFTWVSDTPSIASVDQSGNITAVGNGTATITVSANGVSASIFVVVSQSLNKITITDLGSGNVKAFRAKRGFTAVGLDPDGNPIAGKAVSWKSSDISIATVDSTGTATSNTNGTVTITATIDNLSQTISLVVDQQVASILSLNGSGNIKALKRGRQFQAVDTNGFAIAGKTITWSSSSTGIASIDGTGSATAQGNGTTNIVATVDGITVTTTLTILQDIANIQVTSDTTGKVGALKKQRHFAANAQDPDGYAVTGQTVTWSALDITVVSIDTNGVATSQKNGKTSITAAINGVQSLAVDYEVLQVTSSVSITGDNSNIVALNRKRSFSAAALDSNGNAITGKSASWGSSAGDTLPIDVNGNVTALKNGTSTIQATIDGIAGSISLSVNQIVDHLVGSDTGTIKALNRVRSYKAVDVDGNQIAGKTVTWSSSVSGIAAVDTTGIATAKGNGTTTVSAVVDGITVSASLQVTQQVQTVTITSSETGTIASLNHKRQLQVLARDLDGFVVNDSSRTTTWSSSDATTLSIDTTGLITSKKNGSATVKVVYDSVSSSDVSLQISQVVASIQSSVTGKAKSKGETRQYSAYDAEGSVIQKTVSWSITGDTSVATIDQTGKLTTTHNKTATVTATVDTTTITSAITVEQVAASISITSGSNSLARAGKTTTFQATAYDANGYVVEDKVISWSISDTRVATVSSTGTVVAIAGGTATVSASMDSVTASVSLTVH